MRRCQGGDQAQKADAFLIVVGGCWPAARVTPEMLKLAVSILDLRVLFSINDDGGHALDLWVR
jgi:hypothetical protein